MTSKSSRRHVLLLFLGAFVASSAMAWAQEVPKVRVYGTSWCPACAAVRSYLTERGVAFQELDVEADPSAAAAMEAYARRVGTDPNSVPLTDVSGIIVPGFDRQALAISLRRVGLVP